MAAKRGLLCLYVSVLSLSSLEGKEKVRANL